MNGIRGQLSRMLLRRGDRRFVAVDFDSRRLRLVHAERAGGGLRIVRLIVRPMPEGLDIAEPQPIGEFLRATLKEHGLAGLPVVMCVPRGLAVLKTLTFPPGTQRGELASMVQYQVDKELPFRAEEAVVDFTVTSHFDPEAGANGSQAGISVLVAAVRLPVMDYYRQIALAAHVRLRRLGLRPYANHSCVQACMPDGGDEHRAVLHLTADETEIDVMVGSSLAFSRSALGKIPMPGRGEDAELRDAVQGVVTETIRSLQSYQSVEGGGRVDRIYLAGGTGLEDQVAEQLSRRLELPCQTLSPAELLKLGADCGDGSEFISALGLAIGHSGQRGMPFDFLNPKRPPARRNTKRTRALSVAAGSCAVLLAFIALGSEYLRAKEHGLDQLRDDHNKLVSQKKRVDKLAARLKAVEQWERDTPDWLDHLAHISALMPSCTEVYVPGLTGAPDGSLVFTIRADSQRAITEVIRRLRSAGYDAEAKQQQRKTNDPRYMHTAEMRVSPRKGMKIALAGLKPTPRPADDTPVDQLSRPGRTGGTNRRSGARRDIRR